MLKKIMRFLLGIFGGVIGYQLVYATDMAANINFTIENVDTYFTSPQFIGVMGGAVTGSFILYYILEKLLEFIINFEYRLKELTWEKIIVAFVGLLTGLVFGALVNFAFSIRNIPRVGVPISIFFNIVCVYFGFTLALSKQEEFFDFISHSRSDNFSFGDMENIISNKILDTSVIIDGRILDICQTGFIEGSLVIPEFVLEELRHIADSSDVLKRNRGRRGLDILKKMQKDSDIDVQIVNQDFEEIPEVDSKLVKLAQLIDARVITNDYNLNKVAELQGVRVLNINELANAVKPVVLPGEEMEVKVIKEGKEDGQGVG
ncbi:MAG: PIN/TRAM domain-containing protein, partial [Bacillota bacterium]